MKKICLDPGHGRGCPNKSPDCTYEEQEFAFDLSKRIKSILLQQGVQVTMTRDEKRYPGLTERCEIANKIKDLDLFISIHSNASGEGGWSTPSGHMIYTSQPGESAARNKAARCIIHALQAAGVSVRGDGLMHNDYTMAFLDHHPYTADLYHKLVDRM